MKSKDVNSFNASQSCTEYTFRFTDKMMLELIKSITLIDGDPELKAALLDKLLKGGQL